MNNEDVLADDFATLEEKEDAKKLVGLEGQAHEGALFEDWMRHQAGQKFAKYLETQITLSKNEWLAAADRDQAEVVRLQAQVYAKIKTWINAQIVTGKLAGTELKRYTEESERLTGLIRPPTRPE